MLVFASSSQLQPVALQRLHDPPPELLGVEAGFVQIVGGTELHRRDRDGFVALRREHEHRHPTADEVGDDVDPVLVGQAVVEQDAVDVAGPHGLDTLARRRRFHQGRPVTQEASNSRAVDRVVVDHQDRSPEPRHGNSTMRQ